MSYYCPVGVAWVVQRKTLNFQPLGVLVRHDHFEKKMKMWQVKPGALYLLYHCTCTCIWYFPFFWGWGWGGGGGNPRVPPPVWNPGIAMATKVYVRNLTSGHRKVLLLGLLHALSLWDLLHQSKRVRKPCIRVEVLVFRLVWLSTSCCFYRLCKEETVAVHGGPD